MPQQQHKHDVAMYQAGYKDAQQDMGGLLINLGPKAAINEAKAILAAFEETHEHYFTGSAHGTQDWLDESAKWLPLNPEL